MRAIVCHRHGGPEVMQYEELPRPRPAAGQMLIEAEAIGVNYVDLMRSSGRHPTAPEPPFTPGIETCGRVAETGADVKRFRTGERVIGRCVTHGAYAECVLVEERFTVSCPEMLPAEVGAALFVNGQTAWHALITMGQVQPGETVLITAAAGGVGTCAVQIAKILGAKVMAAAGSEEKLRLAENLGADALVNYTRDEWPQRVLNVTDGRGAELILESVGGAIAAQSLGCWAPGGRMVIFGKASGEPAVITGDSLLFGNRSVRGLAVGMVIENEELMRRAMSELLAWVADGRLTLQIGGRYPLANAADAHRDLKARKTQGKLVLLP
ncbi:MAG: NADPH:quinone oxidoreductase family protein [Planctomycetes bacterium]|nr:NADPH:quinone oxidoreductase family protein [Planctomycetota bacterium]